MLKSSKLRLNSYKASNLVKKFCSVIRQWHDIVYKVSRINSAQIFLSNTYVKVSSLLEITDRPFW